MNERGKRNSGEDQKAIFPAKISSVSIDVALRDHDYVPKDDKVNGIRSSQTVKNVNEVKECVSVSCQTDIDQQQIDDLTQNVAKLRTGNKTLRSTLNNKPALKRELFMDEVLKSDESVKFYTGFPALACLMAIFNLLKPLAEKLKYWDTNKGKKDYFENKPVKKSGKKRSLTIFQEFILTLVMLRLGIIVQHLSDVFFFLFPNLVLVRCLQPGSASLLLKTFC